MDTATEPVEALNELIAISQRYGGDPAFVLAGGGNTSLKLGDRLWVKASGCALASVGPADFVELNRAALEAILDSQAPMDPKKREEHFIKQVMESRAHPELNRRPSVEALLHHLLPDRFVVHTHPGIVNALTCCADGQRLAAELFGDEVLWQTYVDPGLVLAQSLRESLARARQRTNRPPIAILLENHGLVVSGNSRDEIESISKRIAGRIHAHLDSRPQISWTDRLYPQDHQRLKGYAHALQRLMPHLHVCLESGSEIARLAGSPRGRDVALAGPLTPDQIVYCRSIPLWIEHPSSEPQVAEQQLKEACAAYVQTHGFDPWIVLIAGAGMIAFRESPKLAEVTRSIYVDAAAVYQAADRLGGVKVMSRRNQQFIEQWEVEAYRRAVMNQSAGL